jgi:mxaK protein
LTLVAAIATAAAVSWWQKSRDNTLIAAGETSQRLDTAAPLAPALRFAQAYELAVRGEGEAALARYRSLHGERRFGAAARFNSANLLMRQALSLAAGGAEAEGAGQAVALTELAKQSYREVLRADPQHWGARYNFERAQRLQPDADDSDPAIAEPRNDAERASTKMRGIEPGLP